uniref:Predicted nucleic acid-binding protein, contains PIN domain n=1 Tax=Candidatus Kentrum sp. TC TaxID=2126339 RepID=A0A450ZRS5_9GAMM|nr:MAG: Predicted nucleic acid-binding protein, contains PIN domain [Candidatus Kentron sp. TC]VFK56522.1 MAG: Predicted nucleic acid-binding protein, contains PIN domain [Candidatus Kentron sp. TC]
MSGNPGRCFLDTNIWLYAFITGQDPRKTRKAKYLLATAREIVLSTQVINKMCVNLLRKAIFTEREIRELIEDPYDAYLVVELDRAIHLKASELRERAQFSFWDSTIVANALLSGAPILYSEDMQDGYVVEGKTTIVNPFK